MTSHRLMRSGTPEGSAESPCFLAPPLQRAWTLPTGHRSYSGAYLIGDGVLVGPSDESHLVGWREGTLDKIWTGANLSASAITEGGLLLASAQQAAFVLDISTGLEIVEIPDTRGFLGCVVLQGPQAFALVETGDDAPSVLSLDLRTGSIVWRTHFERYWSFSGRPCIAAGRVVVAMRGHGGGRGHIKALDSATGSPVWESNVGDVEWLDEFSPARGPQDGYVAGQIRVHGDIVIAEIHAHALAGLALDTGRRLWVKDFRPERLGAAYLYAGRSYVVTSGSYSILDPSTGSCLFERRIEDMLPRILGETGVGAPPLLVSETHLFLGSNYGHIVAFDRFSGDYTWRHRPDGAANNRFAGEFRDFVAVNGRLYWTDDTGLAYCYEEQEPSDPALRSARAQPLQAREGSAPVAPTDAPVPCPLPRLTKRGRCSKSALSRPLMEPSERHAPVLTFVLPDGSVLKKSAHRDSIESIEARALAGLREQPGNWTLQTLRGEARYDRRLLVCEGPLAAERIVDREFLEEAGRTLDAAVLMVGIPRRDLIAVVACPHRGFFFRFLTEAYEAAGAAALTPAAFQVIEGELTGIDLGWEGWRERG